MLPSKTWLGRSVLPLAGLLIIPAISCASNSTKTPVKSAVHAQALANAIPINVDVKAARKPISPLIYGASYASTKALQELNMPIDRTGGNNTTRYNWLLNADNKGKDWFFESMGDPSAIPGERVDTFIKAVKDGGGQPMITVPTLGWVAKLGPNRGKLASFSIAKYGPQTAGDQWMPDAGNGVSKSTNSDITGNDPNDANTKSDVNFQKEWIDHLTGKWGKADKAGVRYYLIDNEPSIWQSTHRDVCPIGPKADRIVDNIYQYGSMIKAVDPNALIVGPEEWGWTGYLYSGYDQQYGAKHGWGGLPDRQSHNNMDYVAYLLDSMHKKELSTGKRILDIFSLHFYPQGGEFNNGVDTNMQKLRNISTRSLWDPNYVDKSWINDKVRLIPRMHEWVNKYYPGTKLAITEYNWGADSHINGATAQADILGIFGREGLDIAARWVCPDPATPTYKAFKMYRNYDDKKSSFGDISVQDTVSDPDSISSFAAERTSDGALTIMVINKDLSKSQPVAIKVANYSSNGIAQAWQLTSTNVIKRIGDIEVGNNTVSTLLPAQSITLFVLPKVGTVIPKPGVPTGLTAKPGNKMVLLNWTGSDNAVSYDIMRSTNAATGFTSVATAGDVSYIDKSVQNNNQYYYMVKAKNSAGTSATTAAVTVTPSDRNSDPSRYNFETGAQGWVSSGGMITSAEPSIQQSFQGAASLAVKIEANGAEKQSVHIESPPVPAGAKITFHIWIPAGSHIATVQPYAIQPAAGNWAFNGAWTPIANLKPDSWNTVSFDLPAAAKTPLFQIGVEFTTDSAWSGTCYVDSVSW